MSQVPKRTKQNGSKQNFRKMLIRDPTLGVGLKAHTQCGWKFKILPDKDSRSTWAKIPHSVRVHWRCKIQNFARAQRGPKTPRSAQAKSCTSRPKMPRARRGLKCHAQRETWNLHNYADFSSGWNQTQTSHSNTPTSPNTCQNHVPINCKSYIGLNWNMLPQNLKNTWFWHAKINSTPSNSNSTSQSASKVHSWTA